MAKLTVLLLVLLTMVSFAAVWGTETGQSAPKTCTKYAPTKEIITARNKKVSLKTQGRAPVCTNVYSFTFVESGSSMTFNSHVKKCKSPKMINCGLWFWTDADNKLDVTCSIIDVKKEDNMVLFDIDNESITRFSDTVKKEVSFSFQSRNVAIGLEMKIKAKKPSYCCKITSIPSKSKTFVIGGRDDNAGTYSRHVDLISDGKITSLAKLDFDTKGNSVVLHAGKLYTCGGKNMNKKCSVLDLADSSAKWKHSLTLPVYTELTPMMVVGDHLWILIGIKATVIPFAGGDGSKHTLANGLTVNKYSCGGGDQVHRFVIPDGGDAVWINTNPKDAGDWSHKATLGRKSDRRSCMIRGMNIYVTGGRKDNVYFKVAERINLINYERQSLSDMLFPRTYHAMGLFKDEIAVFAGWDGDVIDTVESYNVANKKWIKQTIKLSGGKINEMGFTTSYD